MVCITAIIGRKRHKKVAWADCLLNDRSLRVLQLGPRANRARRDGIFLPQLPCALWDPVHIFSQERQTRNPWRLVRRVPSSTIPILATDRALGRPIQFGFSSFGLSNADVPWRFPALNLRQWLPSLCCRSPAHDLLGSIPVIVGRAFRSASAFPQQLRDGADTVLIHFG